MKMHSRFMAPYFPAHKLFKMASMTYCESDQALSLCNKLLRTGPRTKGEPQLNIIFSLSSTHNNLL